MCVSSAGALRGARMAIDMLREMRDVGTRCEPANPKGFQYGGPYME